MTTWIKTATQKPTAANLPIEVWNACTQLFNVGHRITLSDNETHWREYRPEPPPVEPTVKTRERQDYADLYGHTEVLHRLSYLAGRSDERKKIREIFSRFSSMEVIISILKNQDLPIITDSFCHLAEEIAEEGGAT